jgi:glycerol uptake facilitator-like aquaporin
VARDPRPFVAELIGTAILLTAVVGSGIMGDRLSAGNAAVALLANTLATAAALFTLVLTLGPISGAHFNPLVTLTAAARGGLPRWAVPGYVAAQVVGAVGGVWLAHVMFQEPLLMLSSRARSGPAQFVSEVVATFGLLGTIAGCARQPAAGPTAVACYIASAYWFTASTSFANPAVTLARCLTDTFAGIRPGDVPMFVGAQLVGAAVAAPTFRWLHDKTP